MKLNPTKNKRGAFQIVAKIKTAYLYNCFVFNDIVLCQLTLFGHAVA